jgi:two-component system cell cycle sensor histidine kinase/response regulator CckA
MAAIILALSNRKEWSVALAFVASELADAGRRANWLLAGVGASLCLLLLTLWQARRIRHQRNAARQAEAALRAADQRLRFLAGSLREMVLAYDMNRKLIYANPAVETLTGYSVTEMETEQFICWVDPRDRGRMMQLWETLFQGDSFEDAEYRLITKDGRSKWAMASWGPIRDGYGRQVGIQGSERDVTGRKQAELALSESEERFRSVLESILEWVWEADREGRITYTNSAIEPITGRSREALIGKSILELIHEDDRSEVLRRLPALLQAKEGWKGWLIRCHRKDGGLSYLEMSGAPIFDRTGELMGYRGVANDITGQRALEEQYRQAQRLESVGRLAAGVVHDVNNLLSLINGYSDRVFGSLDVHDPHRSQVEQIKLAGVRAENLTRQLLTFSRKPAAPARRLNLNTIVAGAQTMLGHLLGEDIELTTQLSPSLGDVLADAGQIHQILMNLAVNARDAMPTGGKLIIETGEVALALGDSGKELEAAEVPFVRMLVTDTGPGIDSAIQERLFEPFFTTKAPDRGTGLGLSMVRNIVRQSGGYIGVDSQPGKGTSLRVYLPRAAGGDQAGGDQAASEAGEPSGLRECDAERCPVVMVVDDEESVRNSFQQILAPAGYRVIPVDSGKQALRILGAERLDLVVTDLVMPDLDGLELIQSIRRDHPDVKIIAVSGAFGGQYLRAAEFMGADASLMKPVGAERLRRTVQQVLGLLVP